MPLYTLAIDNFSRKLKILLLLCNSGVLDELSIPKTRRNNFKNTRKFLETYVVIVIFLYYPNAWFINTGTALQSVLKIPEFSLKFHYFDIFNYFIDYNHTIMILWGKVE